MTDPDLPEVFRGTVATASGLVTPDLLRGPQFTRLLPDTYVRAEVCPPDLRLRSLAAYAWAGPGAILCGYSAAELLGASCAPRNAPAEVAVTAVRAGPRTRAGVVRVRRDLLHPDDITEIGGVRTTNRLRTAFDLARRLPAVEGVVAVDALARGAFDQGRLRELATYRPGLRGVRKVTEAVRWADARSGSPPETRLRLILVRAGLSRPVVQHPVVDEHNQILWLDLAYPGALLGIEYDGGGHFATPDAARADARRHTRLVAQGWRVLRYTADDMRRAPGRIVAEVCQGLRAAHRDAAQRARKINNSR
ncbi:DUF559 domain-containing protein [Pseudonocardia sp. NPDC049635]|uniref:endonuclease domain-containing protein n=1 Tax=Pseudonocardia sp. NPDC049635 TaxID=3155506 RepID=UPI00340B7860